MSGQFKKRPTDLNILPPTEISNRRERYQYLAAMHQQQQPNAVSFSKLLERESIEAENYESVTDAYYVQEPKAISTSAAGPGDTVYSFCQRCHRYIGDKPFCFRCFGPLPNPDTPTESRSKWCSFLWIFLGIFLFALTFSCMTVCAMHLLHMGIYREENIVEIKREVGTALAQIIFIERFETGLLRELKRNLALLSNNLTHVEKYHKKINALIDVACEDYMKRAEKDKIGKACSAFRKPKSVIHVKGMIEDEE